MPIRFIMFVLDHNYVTLYFPEREKEIEKVFVREGLERGIFEKFVKRTRATEYQQQFDLELRGRTFLGAEITMREKVPRNERLSS